MPDASASQPISPAEFATALEHLGPFEPRPHLAVAVSGGADSMALVLLAADWVKARGGSATALTVDHRLRPGSDSEARQVGIWLTDRGIDHRILTRDGAAFTGDIQKAARDARYRLMREWCQEQGVLHLLIAHHREDQAETLLLRLGRGSGLFGLSAMAALSEAGSCRVLRPLLNFSHDRLLATLGAAGQVHVQDPSNQNPAFARVRLRQAMPGLGALGLTYERTAETAAHLGRSRIALERELERLLAQAMALHPAGFAQLDKALLNAAPFDLRARAWGAVISMIGNEIYPPRFSRLNRLLSVLADARGFKACTLGGCRIAALGESLLIYRELAAVPPPSTLTGRSFRWDRFDGRVGTAAPLDALTVGALNLQDFVTIGRHSLQPMNIAGRASGIPKKLWPILPVLRHHDKVIAVPHLKWGEMDLLNESDMRFRPGRPLTTGGFFVA